MGSGYLNRYTFMTGGSSVFLKIQKNCDGEIGQGQAGPILYFTQVIAHLKPQFISEYL